LPVTSGEALNTLQRSEMSALALAPPVPAAYLEFERAEIESPKGLNEDEVCRRYAEVY
jgi:glutamine synthetase